MGMKIAMIGSRGIPVTYSGIETHLEQLCPRLVARGHHLRVYCKEDLDFTGDLFQGVHLRRAPAIATKHLETLTRSFISVIMELWAENDIVHFHALGPSVFAILPRICRKRAVVTVHGLDWQRAKWGRFATACLKAGEWTSAQFCDATICVSRGLKEYYIQKYGNSAWYVPNGVNIPDPLPPDSIKVFGLDRKNYILFLSRLVPEKGCHYLIEAFNKIDTSMKLVIAGGAGHTEAYVRYLKDLARNNDRIIFTGFVSGDILKELFSNAYLYVLPSEIEGLPISLLEAMSYALCVLTSDIPENLEITSDCGFSFRNKDPLSLQTTLEILLADSSLVDEKGKIGKEKVIQEYNWDIIAEQTERVYLRIFKHSG
jgi:glycosyltransferase involved in cell wall biosynthesis